MVDFEAGALAVTLGGAAGAFVAVGLRSFGEAVDTLLKGSLSTLALPLTRGVLSPSEISVVPKSAYNPALHSTSP